jgi:hypothetical protein
MGHVEAVTAHDLDRDRADREREAVRHVLRAGAAALPRQPWLHRAQPPSAVDLVRFVVWRAGTDKITEDDLEAALALLGAAREEVEQLEAAVLFTARGRGLTWARISRAMRLGSAQAALQRFDRLTSRVEARAGS